MSDTGRGSHKSRINKRLICECVIFSVLLIIATLFQVSFFRVFGKVPAIVLCFVCAIGFLCSEQSGAICGIVGGFFIDMLGSAEITFSPLLYMLAGYFCGYFLKFFFRKNFPSFIVYSLAVGGVRGIITLSYYAFKTKSFNIVDIFIHTVTPEFFAYLLCVPIAYFTVLGISKILQKAFKNK